VRRTGWAPGTPHATRRGARAEACAGARSPARPQSGWRRARDGAGCDAAWCRQPCEAEEQRERNAASGDRVNVGCIGCSPRAFQNIRFPRSGEKAPGSAAPRSERRGDRRWATARQGETRTPLLGPQLSSSNRLSNLWKRARSRALAGIGSVFTRRSLHLLCGRVCARNNLATRRSRASRGAATKGAGCA
jgi:hypothetical protein